MRALAAREGVDGRRYRVRMPGGWGEIIRPCTMSAPEYSRERRAEEGEEHQPLKAEHR